MVFGWLFGKKKANEPQQQQPKEVQTHPKQGRATQQTTRVPVQQQHKKREQREDEWIYEYLLQYLTSPIWKVPIYDFLDENCIVFDDEEENKFSYTQIHKKFKVMIESMIESLMSEIGVDESTLLHYIEVGLESTTNKKVFEQLLIVDDFLVFKKLMVKRNKEQELEALKELMKGEEPAPEDEQKLKIATLEAERAEIEHAISASVAADEQLRKMKEMEDEDLQRVLELSKLSFQNEEESRSKQQLEQQVPTPVPDQSKFFEQEESKAKLEQKPIEQKNDKTFKVQKAGEEEESKEEALLFKPLQKLPVLKPISALPPLIEKKYEKPVEDLLQDRMALMKQLDNYKAAEERIKNEKLPEKKVEENPAEQKESLEERKQRLLAQRELLRKKKQVQREKELTEYKETGDNSKKGIDSQQSLLLSENSNNSNSENISQAELQKRQALMSKIRQNM